MLVGVLDPAIAVIETQHLLIPSEWSMLYTVIEPIIAPPNQQDKEKLLLKMYITHQVLSKLGYTEDLVLSVSITRLILHLL